MAGIFAEPWGWIALGVALAIAELLLPGYFLIWIAAAALITGLAATSLPLTFAAQVLLFAGLAVLATLGGRRWYSRNPGTSADPMLNDRGGQLVGQTATVSAAISGGSGRVRHGDTEWLARGADAATGARVRIVGHDGTVLVVEPLG
jgi:hypothetical protein